MRKKSKTIDHGVIKRLDGKNGPWAHFNRTYFDESGGCWRVERARQDGGLEIATFSGYMAEEMARLFEAAIENTP